jgi:transposase InsO family protein
MSYSRIEKLIKKGVFYNVNIDVKLLKSLLLARCDICLRAKLCENPHKGNLKILPVPWRTFSTDLSAKFDQPSIEGNFYHMAIIDNFTKYVWYYYLVTKDQAFNAIAEFLEEEIQALRGRDRSDYELVLMSDLGEAHSKKIIAACKKYGILKTSTAGYTPQHNAFIERWFRTNSEMSRCQILQFDMEEEYWESSRRHATFLYNRVPATSSNTGELTKAPFYQQYPTRVMIDLTKLQPFEITCWVFIKKARRPG